MGIQSGHKFEAGERYVAYRDGTKYIGEFKAGKDGKLYLHAVAPKGWKAPTEEVSGKPIAKRLQGGSDGRTFVSLDAFGMATTYPKVSPSIYVFFTPEADFVVPTPKVKAEKPVKAEKAPKVEGEKATKKARAKRTTTKRGGKTFVNGFTVMDNGHYFCAACMEGFAGPEDGSLPEQCPEGHVHGVSEGEPELGSAEAEDIADVLNEDESDEAAAVAEAEAVMEEATA